ncbi:MAG: CDP-alcohol phosphatidyltransferase family protein [Ignavibacteria bacterium]
MNSDFSYEKTLKTKNEKDFLNFQHYLLFSSDRITKFLYYTSVTPHQVILFSMFIGILSAFLIIQENWIFVILGALFLFYKNVFDKVDGSLARAKGITSRRGRFYDSLSDFVVSLTLFSAISYKLFLTYNNYFVFLLCFLALISSMIQCSFFVYYQVSFIKFSGFNTVNRLVEYVTEEDLKNQDRLTILLQRMFMIIYGWQDILISKLDEYLFNKLESRFKILNPQSSIPNPQLKNLWYYHKTFLSISSLLSIGSHMVLIALFAVLGRFEYYLFINLIIGNLTLLIAGFYHYYSVKKSLKCI